MSRNGSAADYGNLPYEVDSFVGRKQLTADTRGRLAHAALVTLVGAGGVGKTRLALHLAHTLRRSFPDGVWFVELGEVSDAAMVGHTVAAVLRLRNQSASSPDVAVADFFAGKRALLVLDNAEHLLDPCAVLVAGVLRASALTRVIATSREPLGVAGEHTIPVPPLGLPVSPDDRSCDRLSGSQNSEALELFEQRAAAAVPGFMLDNSNRAVVTELCRKLDGIPLAIELAAVRLRAMDVASMLARLNQDLGLPDAQMRGVSARHRTLDAAIGWSYALCSDNEQRMWNRLSVFAGSFAVEAVISICCDDGLRDHEALTSLLALVEKSIVIRQGHIDTPRYRLLEPLRQHGRRELAAAGEDRTFRRRHLDHFHKLTMCAEQGLGGNDQVHWSSVIETEWSNLRAAFEYSLDKGENEKSLQMSSGMWFFWVTGPAREGRHWLDRAIEASGTESPHLPKTLWVRAWVVLTQGDHDAARTYSKAALGAAEQAGEADLRAHCLQTAASAEQLGGNLDESIRLYELAIGHYRRAGSWNAISLAGLAELAWARLLSGSADAVQKLCEEGRLLAEARGEQWALSWIHWVLGVAARAEGQSERASRALHRSLQLKLPLHDWLGISFVIETLSWISADRGHHAQATRLLAANHALWQPVGQPLFGFGDYLDLHESYLRRLRESLGEQKFQAIYDDGLQLRPEEAVAEALGEGPPTSSAADKPDVGPSPLTPREREVAALVAGGSSNREIAEALVISKRTAETHVENIFVKLGFTSRVEMAAWAKTPRT